MKRVFVLALVVISLMLSACGQATNAPGDSYADLAPQYAPTEQAATPPVEKPKMRSPEDGVEIVDNEFFTIKYLGCEMNESRNRPSMIFYVTNKTEVSLRIMAESMAFDGQNLGYVYGTPSIAPLSSGKINLDTDEPFPTMEPKTISGELSVMDNGHVLGVLMYSVPFANVDVS